METDSPQVVLERRPEAPSPASPVSRPVVPVTSPAPHLEDKSSTSAGIKKEHQQVSPKVVSTAPQVVANVPAERKLPDRPLAPAERVVHPPSSSSASPKCVNSRKKHVFYN